MRASRGAPVRRRAGAGRILRGIVHLRPAPSYRQLVVVDALPGEDSCAEEVVPSASA